MIHQRELVSVADVHIQAKLSPNELEDLAKTLEIPIANLQSELGDHWWPNRGSLGPIPPTDPVIYRLYEVSALDTLF